MDRELGPSYLKGSNSYPKTFLEAVPYSRYKPTCLPIYVCKAIGCIVKVKR
jgi:hypothetical protein